MNSVMLAGVLCCAAAGAQDLRQVDALRIAVEHIRYTDDAGVAATGLAAPSMVAEFYERRNFRPAWREAGKIEELVTVVRAAYADGLSPADYHLEAIEEGRAGLEPGDPEAAVQWAAFELLLTDALMSLVYHQTWGKADPLKQHATWNLPGAAQGPGTLAIAEEAFAAESLAGALEERFRRNSYYQRLRAALASYRRIAADGGWPRVPDGPALRPGMRDPRVGTLAARLAVTGDLGAGFAASDTVDDELEQAIRRFQSRHGLDADGIAGRATLQALNVPVEERVQQLRLTLERARWVMDDLGSRFIVVNIAGFRAYVVADRRITWETRVVVGREHQQTPVFRDEVQYLVFNPTWTVPYSIATREMLPQIRAEPGWFESRDFLVRDRSGALVDPARVDWSTVTARNFEYSFVQPPGAANALGQVKFIFPNPHSVYLHDTPARQLFSTAQRAFSHGCIRVENPLDLAELLLRDDGWDRRRIDSAVASGRTMSVFLREPLPILILYWTASVDPDGTVHFHRDVYNRDAPVAQALDGAFHIG